MRLRSAYRRFPGPPEATIGKMRFRAVRPPAPIPEPSIALRTDGLNDSPQEGHGFEPPVPPESTRSGLAELNGSCAVFSLLPVHHRKAAVELSSELHAGVDVDCTFHRVSGGDQCRRSLQARGLERGFLFVGHETRSPGWRPQPE